MAATAKIIADSTNWLDKRLTTFVLEYPRYIHSELMTHRVFSKNSASSRAIPIPKMINSIKDNPVLPIWTKNQRGMQGELVDNQGVIDAANVAWYKGFEYAVSIVGELQELEIHKQNANRLLEPWMHIRIILTGTEFDNWFALRAHPDAQPEIQELARAMQVAFEGSIPKYLGVGEWHIPFGDDIDELELARHNSYAPVSSNIPEFCKHAKELHLKVSVARCARISYNNIDGSKGNVAGDLELFDKLITQEPAHYSPTEHIAKVPTEDEFIDNFDACSAYDHGRKKWYWRISKYNSNLIGWIQLRKILEAKEDF